MISQVYPEVAAILQDAVVAVASIVIAVAIRTAVKTLAEYIPEFALAWIDEKRQADLHKAATSAVRRLVVEGKDPAEELDHIREYVFASAKDAIHRFVSQGRTMKQMADIVDSIALSKIPAVLEELDHMK